MNKYIPSEKNDNKPCQNKECPMHNTENEYPDNCDLMNHTRWMHNCKGYQPEQEENPCNTCRWFCPVECPPVDCDNFSAWMPREEAPIIPTGVCPKCGHPDSARCNEDYPGFTECEECGYIPEQEEKKRL